MARKSDIKAGVHLYGPDGYLGIALARPIGQAAHYRRFAGTTDVIDYGDVTLGPDPAPKALVAMAVDHLVRSGQRFTSDEVWPMLAIYDNVSSAKHGPLLGQIIQKRRQRGQLRTVRHEVTAASAPHSRAVPVWAPAGRRKAAA